MTKNYSHYEICWVIITAAEGGIVTQADVKKLAKLALDPLVKKGCTQYRIHFSSKSRAEEFIKNAPVLSKKYKYTICTDKQFGDSTVTNGVANIKFTAKQLSETVVK